MVPRSTAAPTGQITDDVLATRIAQGDAAALEILYDRYAPLVLGIALKILGDREIAETVLQETFWRAWQSAASYSAQSGPFTGWLYRIARSLALEAERGGSS